MGLIKTNINENGEQVLVVSKCLILSDTSRDELNNNAALQETQNNIFKGVVIDDNSFVAEEDQVSAITKFLEDRGYKVTIEKLEEEGSENQ